MSTSITLVTFISLRKYKVEYCSACCSTISNLSCLTRCYRSYFNSSCCTSRTLRTLLSRSSILTCRALFTLYTRCTILSSRTLRSRITFVTLVTFFSLRKNEVKDSSVFCTRISYRCLFTYSNLTDLDSSSCTISSVCTSRTLFTLCTRCTILSSRTLSTRITFITLVTFFSLRKNNVENCSRSSTGVSYRCLFTLCNFSNLNCSSLTSRASRTFCTLSTRSTVCTLITFRKNDIEDSSVFSTRISNLSCIARCNATNLNCSSSTRITLSTIYTICSIFTRITFVTLWKNNVKNSSRSSTRISYRCFCTRCNFTDFDGSSCTISTRSTIGSIRTRLTLNTLFALLTLRSLDTLFTLRSLDTSSTFEVCKSCTYISITISNTKYFIYITVRSHYMISNSNTSRSNRCYSNSTISCFYRSISEANTLITFISLFALFTRNTLDTLLTFVTFRTLISLRTFNTLRTLSTSITFVTLRNNEVENCGTISTNIGNLCSVTCCYLTNGYCTSISLITFVTLRSCCSSFTLKTSRTLDTLITFISLFTSITLITLRTLDTSSSRKIIYVIIRSVFLYIYLRIIRILYCICRNDNKTTFRNIITCSSCVHGIYR